MRIRMKKICLLFCILFSSVFFFACTKVELNPEPVPIPPVPKGNGVAVLSWDIVSTNIVQEPLTGEVRYRIYFGIESGKYLWEKDVGTGTIEDDRVSYTFRDLGEGNEYFFVVRAYSSGGESSNSNEVSKFVE